MINTIQDLLTRSPAASTVTLDPAVTYQSIGTVTIKDRRLNCNGATILHTGSATLRDEPIFRLVGHRPEIANAVIRGSAEEGAGFNETLEGQHAIEVNGAQSPTIDNVDVSNVYGDLVNVTKPLHQEDGTNWTTGLRLRNVVGDEIGRHFLNLDAATDTFAATCQIGRCNLDLICMEPPGTDWGCIAMTCSNFIVKDHGGGFVVGSKGKGRTSSVRDITIQGFHCVNRPFTMSVSPDKPGVRRRNFRITDVWGAGILNGPMFVFRHVDGIYTRNINQKFSREVTQVLDQRDCTEVTEA